MRSYADYLDRKRHEYGKRFSANALNPDFIPFYENGRRIEVRFSCGTIKRGRIGVTTGWVPCFILLLTRRSLGSCWTIGQDDKVLRVVAD